MRTHTDDEGLPPATRDMIAMLAASFPPRCIQPGEDVIAAHRYAAQVELVQQLVEMQRESDENPRPL